MMMQVDNLAFELFYQQRSQADLDLLHKYLR